MPYYDRCGSNYDALGNYRFKEYDPRGQPETHTYWFSWYGLIYFLSVIQCVGLSCKHIFYLWVFIFFVPEYILVFRFISKFIFIYIYMFMCVCMFQYLLVRGYANFDNVAIAYVNIFQSLTQDNWSYLMNYVWVGFHSLSCPSTCRNDNSQMSYIAPFELWSALKFCFYKYSSFLYMRFC